MNRTFCMNFHLSINVRKAMVFPPRKKDKSAEAIQQLECRDHPKVDGCCIKNRLSRCTLDGQHLAKNLRCLFHIWGGFELFYPSQLARILFRVVYGFTNHITSRKCWATLVIRIFSTHRHEGSFKNKCVFSSHTTGRAPDIINYDI